MNNFALRKNFWKNKKVFITGHNGFKGTWLCLTLKILGAKVYGYSLKPPTEPNLFNLLSLKNKITKSFFGDIRNKKRLNEVFKKVRPDVVFHLAAQPLVLDSYKSPFETFEINFLGTLNILEITNNFKNTKSTIIVTTDKVYKISNKKKIYSENDELGITDPYGSSKVTAEIVSECYIKLLNNNKKKIKAATVRAGNVLGGGDFSKNRLVPDFIRSLENNTKLKVRNPDHIRPWQFVMEPLYGYILLAEKIYKNKISINEFCWNFAPDQVNCIKVKKFIKFFNKNFKNKLKIYFTNTKKVKLSKETKILRLKSNRAKKVLKWKPQYNVEKIIELIKQWYFYGYKNKKNHETLIKNQIIDFVSKS